MNSPRTFAVSVIFLALGLSVCGAPDGGVRVVSQTVGTDELLLAVAEPEQVAALSHLADDENFSAVATEARRYPKINRGDVESILKHRPTLLLSADYSRIELIEQVRRAGVKVVVLTRYFTLEDAYANLRMVAREIGGRSPARAESIIADCERRIAILREKLRGVKPVRVIAPSTYGVIPGTDTTFEDQCAYVGAINLAATLGKLHGHAAPPTEQMLTWPIDRVVVAGNDLASALAPFRTLPPYSMMAAVKEGRAALIKPYMISSVSHHRVDGYEMLAQALHPEAFK